MNAVVQKENVAKVIRETLAQLESLAAWTDGTAPAPQQIYAPPNHGRVLDLSRTLVVGNRGVGKSFWSSALVDSEARTVAASAYPRSGIENVSRAVFGFRGGIADEITPNKDVLQNIIEQGMKPERLWLAVALRAIEETGSNSQLKRLLDVAQEVQGDVEGSQLRLRRAAELLAGKGKKLLLVFDALDRLGDTWAEIRPLTEGLFRFALSVRGLSGLALKIFVRPDQVADPLLQQFPDASKLLAERVDLRWRPFELYGLMFFHLWRSSKSRQALAEIAKNIPLVVIDPLQLQMPWPLEASEHAQKSLFIALAGEWMGANKKRGSTFTWMPQHLADAREETSPRSFIRALSGAAQYEPALRDQAIDYQGIKQGVIAASQVRVTELTEDHWWIARALEPLRGITVPCEQDVIFERWRSDNTCRAIRSAARHSGLLPILFEAGKQKLSNDEMSLLETLNAISVVEIRANGKANFPDIFRVGAGIKRKGGVRPPTKA